jgi:bifunctional non-homologous end joining protein LigD
MPHAWSPTLAIRRTTSRSGTRKAAKRSAGMRRPPAAPAPAVASPRGANDDSAVRLTHPERVLFADPVISKADLAAFYRGIAPFILPGMINRPLMLLRCPDGAVAQCFFQKHTTGTFPAAVHEVTEAGSAQRWMYITGLSGLMALVQMNAVEYHVWGSTIADLEHADRLVIDLDPDPSVGWRAVVNAALELRNRLQSSKLVSFVRTSGGKGLHLVIPLQPAVPWNAAARFCRTLAENLTQEYPERYLAHASKSERRGRIFVDYLRNARGATAVCSYSLRHRPGAPIATPLSWEELPKLRAPDQFRYDNIKRRLAALSGDPWEGVGELRQTLPVTAG